MVGEIDATDVYILPPQFDVRQKSKKIILIHPFARDVITHRSSRVVWKGIIYDLVVRAPDLVVGIFFVDGPAIDELESIIVSKGNEKAKYIDMVRFTR